MGRQRKPEGPLPMARASITQNMKIARLRTGIAENILDEIKDVDEALVMASEKTVLLTSIDDGLEILKNGDLGDGQAWRDRGFTSREELLVAIHAQKSKTQAPIGLIAALERFSWRCRDNGGNSTGEGAKVIAVPAPENPPK